MTEPAAPVCVLVVADSDDVGALVEALAEPLPTTVVPKIEVVVTGGGDDAIDVFEARRPPLVIVCATLVAGDAASLIEALRGMVPRGELAVVVIGDRAGPQSIAAGVAELLPEAFVSRPIVGRALRYAVASSLERVMHAKSGSGTSPGTDPNAAAIGEPRARPSASQLLRARWEALADSIVEGEPVADESEPHEAAPLPPPQPWSDPSPPSREPTLIIRDPEPPSQPSIAVPQAGRAQTVDPPPPIGRTTTGDLHVDMIERPQGGQWSEPMPLSALGDRDSKRDLDAQTIERLPNKATIEEVDDSDVLEAELVDDELESISDFNDDDLVTGDDLLHRPTSAARIEVVEAGPPERDFARQLRAKMSMMAQRLFQGSDASAPSAADLSPRHDHSTEIDLASLGEETPLGGGVTEIEARASRPIESARELTTSPGSWDTAQMRERGLPDGGELVRGVSDAAMLLARMFATNATGRVTFRRPRSAETPPVVHTAEGTGVTAVVEKAGGVEKTVFFDQGRPVFASSSEPRDRMGELLVREGKITASQYERCQTVVAESGRRMGEILVDFGYLKRRELLPAVRRHVEDIVYSLFGWDRGQYMIVIDTQPSAERRLGRVAEIFNVKVSTGLDEVLDQPDMSAAQFLSTATLVFQGTMQRNLVVAPRKSPNPNAGEMASSDRFKAFIRMAREQFDVVVIDTPPVMITPEPLSLAELTHGVVFVCRSGLTHAAEAREAVETLRERRVQVAVILNGVRDTPFQQNRYRKYSYYYEVQPKPGDQGE